ncbi:MAG: GNAT family N-acetyltransferase [Bacteroidales bacterium]|nr:GNAT family N-acetyltransferase [Bacteroidales bacterium]
MGILIRIAKREDSTYIAKAILLALGMDLDNLEKESIWGEKCIMLFQNLAEREDSQYSYKNSFICEVDASVVGVLVAYDGAKLIQLREALYDEISKMGLGEPKGLTDETEPGEFYIDSLAVFEEYRGRGIATKLIEEARVKALSLNIERLGLLVDKENPNAARLYTKLGFKYIEDKLFLGHKMEHMQKQVNIY